MRNIHSKIWKNSWKDYSFQWKRNPSVNTIAINTIAKFIQRANSAKDDLMSNFLTEETLTHIAESTLNKIIKK